MNKEQDNRPNILLIITDQQRGDCVGIDPHAPSVLQTPNLDFIGRSGTHFHHAYTECPSCIPARRSLMTGTAPAANGAVGYQGGIDWNPKHTLPGELARAGYQTQLIGKLHLHPDRKRYGFQHMQLANATRGETKHNDYVDWLRERHGRTETDPGMSHGVDPNGWVGRPHLLPEEQMHTFWCFDQAMQFLKTRDPSAPYFLKISVIDPHPPLTPPAFYYQRYIDRKIPSPVVGDWAPNFGGPQKGLATDASEIHLPEQDMRCARAAYYGMINFVDDQVGRLMQFEANEAREWFIIFTSDHGEMLGDHNLYRKTWPYEASARIPFLVRAPDSWDLPGEQVCESPVGLQDVMPTILDATGVDIPDTCTGKSLLPIIRGDATAVRDFLHGEHSGCYRNDQGNHFLTDGHEKYIWYSQTGVEQLFDLDADPHETVNLADKPNAQNTLGAWRAKLVVILDGRPEGFTDGKSLVPGRPHGTLLPGYDPDAQYPFL